MSYGPEAPPSAGDEALGRTQRLPSRNGSKTLARAAVALVSAAPLVLLVQVVWTYIDTYARHLCGCPAEISCDGGSPVWNLVTVGIGALVVVAIAGLAGWIRRPSLRAPWLLAGWLIGFVPVVIIMRPRGFGMGDLVVDVAYAIVGVGLAALTGAELLPQRRRIITAASLVVVMTVLVPAVALPGMLSAVAP